MNADEHRFVNWCFICGFFSTLKLFQMELFPLKEETYGLIGLCMEIQKTLGFGFSEIIYKDAMEIEFENNEILYSRESEMAVDYKGIELRHRFVADFVLDNSVIVEVKTSDKGITDDHIAQVLNYLRVSNKAIGMIINFGTRRLEFKRLISTHRQFLG